MESLDLIAQLATHPSPREMAAARREDLNLEHTIDHADCPACMAADEILRANPEEMRDMTFSAAGLVWSRRRSNDQDLRERGLEAIVYSLRALEKFFGKVILRRITAGMVKQYQEARKRNVMVIAGEEYHPWRSKAGPSAINHDINVLAQMLQFCKLWAEIDPSYFPLAVPEVSENLRVLEEEEEEYFFSILKKTRDPQVKYALWVAATTVNTSASGIELRTLRMKDVELKPLGETSMVHISRGKNDQRLRSVTLDDAARYALSNLKARAIELGSCEDDHYLIPFRVKRNLYDPTRPATRSFLRKAWDKLREASGFADLSPHMLRHLCLTKLFEQDNDLMVVRSIAGHVTEKMAKRYCHIRRKRMKKAVDSIDNSHMIPIKSNVVPIQKSRAFGKSHTSSAQQG
jgi:integrase